jgi:hypothetical protein
MYSRSKQPSQHSASIILERILARVAELGMTVNEVSAKAGSRDLIRGIKRNISKGATRGVSTETLRRLSEVLRTTPEYLMAGIEPPA